jgi:hypothetical protein
MDRLVGSLIKLIVEIYVGLVVELGRGLIVLVRTAMNLWRSRHDDRNRFGG